MKFAIAIEPGNDTTAWDVVVPDLPGCFSAGDTMSEAMVNAVEAIDLWCQAVADDGGTLPLVKAVDEHVAAPEFKNWMWAMIDVPIERYLGSAEKINITLPRVLLAQVDECARAHGESRSGLLARVVREAMLSVSVTAKAKRIRDS